MAQTAKQRSEAAKKAAATKKKNAEKQDETKLDAPEGADIGNAEAIPSPEEPAEETPDITEDPSGRIPVATAPVPEGEHVLTRDETKPDYNNLQSVFVQEKD